MTKPEIQLGGWFGLAAIILAAFVYLHRLDSEHAATNPDELLYLQIARLTADTGAWLPLQSVSQKTRNTKPPGLFWQGIASSDRGKSWELWRLRYPCALYSLATAAMAFLLARKIGGGNPAGVIAALAYLAFFGVYRHGRVFLTSAPETFWLFAPFFVLLMWRPRERGLSWPLAFSFGLMIGIALLYKSFALVVPAAAGLAWWTLHQRGYLVGPWLRRDMPKIAMTSLLALGVFSLWYWLDPQRHLILGDFILKENIGKLDAGDESYLLNLLSGKHSIWAYTLGWLTNAGLLAPAVIAVFVIALLRRREAADAERLLWIWIAVVFLTFVPSNLRYERYLIPAMPALAVICALHWDQIPRWILGVTLFACAVLVAGMGAGAILLTRALGEGALYAWSYWALIAGSVVFALSGLAQARLTRAFTLPAIFLVYLGYAGFLTPFDGPRGEYDRAAIDAVRGKTVALPSPHGARDEIHRFMLPGSDVRLIKKSNAPTIDELSKEYTAFILSRPLGDTSLENTPGLRVLGRRLALQEYYNDEETLDMLRGNVARNMFYDDVLVEVVTPPSR